MTDFNKISSSVYKNMDFCYTNSRMYSFFNCLPATAHFSIFFCHLCLLCSSLLPICSPKQLRVNDRCEKQPGSRTGQPPTFKTSPFSGSLPMRHNFSRIIIWTYSHPAKFSASLMNWVWKWEIHTKHNDWPRLHEKQEPVSSQLSNLIQVIYP